MAKQEASEMERLRKERDAALEQVIYWRERAVGTEDERDALVAHVDDMERRGDQMAVELRDWLGSYGPDDETERMLEVWEEAKSRRPKTSLARLKAKWQAEAVVEFGYRYGPESEVRAASQSVANELRRQAE
jgi:hypothetical protein